MRLIHWLKHNRPSREAMLENRVLRPFAHVLGDPNIWHFNRRSVARGVALGMFFGFAIPFLQIPAAAAFAVSARANLAIAALCTFISNPLTTPFIYFGAYEIGAKVMRVPEASSLIAAYHNGDWTRELRLLLTGSPEPIAIGLVLIGLIAAALGFAVIQIVWRVWVRQRWQARAVRRLAGGGAAA
jgi:uncharacterized protein (DUF2062 family)